MIQNTSETRETLGRYTIPQLESMVEAIGKTNESSTNNKKVLEGQEALDFLINSGGKL